MEAYVQAARKARKGIEQVRKLLLCPTAESVAACAAPLQEAIRCMENLQDKLTRSRPFTGPPAQILRTEVLNLTRELSQAQALLTSAGRFYEGYGRLLLPDQPPDLDYSAMRRPSQSAAVRRFVVHG